jgi:glycosyltransferase involved in cell wall biosynthesis
MADMVTTPSKILAEVFKNYNNNVKVLKNYLDLNIWKPLNIVKDDKIRIVWQGGHSHFEDWFEVRDALKIVMDKYKNVVLVIMGSEFEGTALPSDRVEKVGWVSMDAYPHVFKTLNADIGICPLKNSSFNVCKSELKWEEYSALKIPTVASMTHPYSDYIEDGETGFLCKNTDEWVKKLSLLIESKEIRETVGSNARKHVEKNYDADKKWVEYESAYKSLTSRILEVV